MAAQLRRPHPMAQSRAITDAPVAARAITRRPGAVLAPVLRTTLRWLCPEPIAAPGAATPYLGAPPRRWPRD
jgi:hypothetical protein